EKTEDSFGELDFWIIKLDSIGNIIWDKTIGGNNYDLLTTLIQTSDGGFLLGGNSDSGISGNKTENSKGDYDYWIVKID
ncbi:MAG TPA: T9SS C-terminal target domain-containing protein, partial [Bacteroidia bacterium]|nr:T9SS C-terminal target domain-containing protein [Bacteroidia bacterium]